jgi:hypothetical protein
MLPHIRHAFLAKRSAFLLRHLENLPRIIIQSVPAAQVLAIEQRGKTCGRLHLRRIQRKRDRRHGAR